MTKQWGWLAATLLAGVLVRWALLVDYPPQSMPDTSTYFQAARDLVTGDFSIGEGRRTPGYPLFIALLGHSPQAVVFGQMATGLLMSALLFGMVRLLGGPPLLAFAAGVSYHLNLQQLVQEGMLLTETLSAVTVAAALWVFLLGMRQIRLGRWQPAWWAMVLSSVMAGYAILVRPQFLPMLVVLPLLAVYAVTGARRPTLRGVGLAAGTVVPAVAMLLVWCAVLNAKTGYFTMSTQSGIGLVNHPIDYIERAPEEFAAVRDVLLKTREARRAEVGHTRNTIWYAMPEIRRVTGWTLPEASVQLKRMCTRMFIENPLTHARSVASAWVDFWTVPIFWQPDAMPSRSKAQAMLAVWKVEHWLLRLANLAFVLVTTAALLLPAVRRRLHWDIGLTALVSTVLGSSLIQALADQGASSRYHLPTQALVVMVLLVVAWRWRRRVDTAAA